MAPVTLHGLPIEIVRNSLPNGVTSGAGLCERLEVRGRRRGEWRGGTELLRRERWPIRYSNLLNEDGQQHC